MSEMSLADKAAFRAGESARIEGKPITNSPHLHMTNADIAWKDGWRKTDYELRSAKRSH